jgi:hypothetical protein
MNECLARSVRQRREDDDSDDEASLPHQNVEQISAANGIYWTFFFCLFHFGINFSLFLFFSCHVFFTKFFTIINDF